jgi:hypothetical protein
MLASLYRLWRRIWYTPSWVQEDKSVQRDWLGLGGICGDRGTVGEEAGQRADDIIGVNCDILVRDRMISRW